MLHHDLKPFLLVENDKAADMLKALGHPVRLKVIRHLLSNTCCCCGELCEGFNHSQSTVSQHLGVLKEAGILIARKDGNRMLYSVEPAAFRDLQALFTDFTEQARKLEH